VCERDQFPLVDVPLTDEAAAALGPKKDFDSEPADPRVRTTLEFPWGEVEVKDRLNVGRDPEFSPLAHKIANNDYVSRRHAEVFVKEGFLYIQHLGTTNPTYLNGKPIEAEATVELADGDEISFSRHLTARVRLG
jgi:hypothetical protein